MDQLNDKFSEKWIISIPALQVSTPWGSLGLNDPNSDFSSSFQRCSSTLRRCPPLPGSPAGSASAGIPHISWKCSPPLGPGGDSKSHVRTPGSSRKPRWTFCRLTVICYSRENGAKGIKTPWEWAEGGAGGIVQLLKMERQGAIT